MSLKDIHPDLLEVQEGVYSVCSFITSDFSKEVESSEYGACDFKLSNKKIKFRIAKITPKKVGQFVTLWKRIGSGPILPYDLEDPFDFYVVSVRTCEGFGQFVFPKNVLYDRGIISKDGRGGKRAMRVYPPWDIAVNS
jgi:hypothetical protein